MSKTKKLLKYFPKPLKIYELRKFSTVWENNEILYSTTFFFVWVCKLEVCRPTKILCYTVSHYHLLETEIAKYSHTHTLIHTALQEVGPDLWWAHYFKQRVLICDEPTTSSRGSWSVMSPLLQAGGPDHAVMSALFQYCLYMCGALYTVSVEFAISACNVLHFEFLIWTVYSLKRFQFT